MAPTFFLPHLPVEFQEASFAHLAKRCGCEVPPIGGRVYSISFERGGIMWIATVGCNLKGNKPIRVKRNDTGRWRDIEDPALVLAIFPGESYCLLTYPGTASLFGSTFYAIAKRVELFSV